jgi:hypothetical protein
LDLRCWMALATRALATVGSNLGLPRKGEPHADGFRLFLNRLTERGVLLAAGWPAAGPSTNHPARQGS